MIDTIAGIMGVIDNSQVGSMTSQFVHNPIDEIKLITVKQKRQNVAKSQIVCSEQ